jgi:uncharacterized repeat protein (TIGR03803 family)
MFAAPAIETLSTEVFGPSPHVQEGLLMRSRKFSNAFALTLAIFTASLLATGKLAVGQQETIVHSFGGGQDGANPQASLISDAGGNLYGTTFYGGNDPSCYHPGLGCGTVFELTHAFGGDWTEKTLYNFNGTGADGVLPGAGLIFDGSSNLYGTTYAGGAYGGGTVFELTPNANGDWTERTLHNFGDHSKDGTGSQAALVFDAAGNLYGTTYSGGAYGYGTVFELAPIANGGWTEKILLSFYNNGRSGIYPFAGLTFDASGNLYGTTYTGGVFGAGTAFELSPSADGRWTEKILHNFGDTSKDGIATQATLVLDAAGNLYGTTYGGGAHVAGTVFELTPKIGGGWSERILHNFNDNGKDGTIPYFGVVRDATGNLYGTTYSGGIHGAGAVFELIPTAGGGWTEKILRSFGGSAADGATPFATVILGADGNLYGTTEDGGLYGHGTVFEIRP